MTPTPEALIKVAYGQKGYAESGGRDGKSGNITKYGAAYGMNAVAWCSIFVWWCFMQIGINLKVLLTAAYASAEQAMEAWAAHGWKVYKNPRMGDVAFFHFDGENEGANHTGIVIATSATGIHTIEGNTSMPGAKGSQVNGGGAYERFRPFSLVIGYGRYPWATPAPKAPVLAPVVGKSYPTLRQGDSGPQVKRLQTLLHITADGQFGPDTAKHVKQAEFNRQLLQDGIAGPALLSKLGY